MPGPMTGRELVAYGKGLGLPGREAWLTVAAASGQHVATLASRGRDPLDPAAAARARAWLRARADGVPLAYLTGQKEFWTFSLRVTPEVLVPRPETEGVVEEALRRRAPAEGEVFVDVGTGSGALALALALERPQARVLATDLSPSAVEVAKENAARLGLAGRVHVLRGDLLAPVIRGAPVAHLVVANLPYVSRKERDLLPPEVRREPWLALDGGEDGLEVIRRLVRQLPWVLLPGGDAVLEVGAGQGEQVLRLLAEALPGGRGSVLPDLAGVDRIVAYRAP